MVRHSGQGLFDSFDVQTWIHLFTNVAKQRFKNPILKFPKEVHLKSGHISVLFLYHGSKLAMYMIIRIVNNYQ